METQKCIRYLSRELVTILRGLRLATDAEREKQKHYHVVANLRYGKIHHKFQ